QGGFFGHTPDQRHWTKVLAKRGWSVPYWPVELGGCNWTPLQHFIFQDEHSRVDAPQLPLAINHMIGPVIYRFGSEDLKARLLKPTREGLLRWCQGFSEPGAGSDLVSLRTRAVLDGDHYVVNGQKIWSSGAHEYDWLFCLCRTNTEVKPQK